MATPDVPGANPKNNDKLSALNWAEHDDGSLVIVYQVTEKEVVFSLFDSEKEFKSKMNRKEFERQFSKNVTKKPSDSKIVWTWHDKTPIPWDRALQSRSRIMTITETTAAHKVGRAINAEAGKIDKKALEKQSRSMYQKLFGWLN